MGPVSVCRVGAVSADPSCLFGDEVPESDLRRAAWLGWLPLALLDYASLGLVLAGDTWLTAPSRGLAPPGPDRGDPGFWRPLGTAEAAGFTGVFSFRERAIPYELREHER